MSVDVEKILKEIQDPEIARDFINGVYKYNISWFMRGAFAITDPATLYNHNWHIDCISEYLQAVHTGEIKRLIINIEPRSLKSMLCSVAYPAWELGVNPSQQIICASYGQTLADILSVKTRLIMESPWYRQLFPNTKLSKDQNKKDFFQTTKVGHRAAMSVRGGVTGFGANLFIIDDIVKAVDANSQAKLIEANTWIQETAMSRKNDPKNAAYINIMQRLNENDSTQLCLDLGWEHLCIPTICESKTIMDFGRFKKTREVGEVLHEKREGLPEIELKKKEFGESGFAGQCQQRPVALGGGILKQKWWRVWDKPILPRCDLIMQVYDTAFKEKEENDYSARTTWGVFNYTNHEGLQRHGCIMLDAKRGKWDYPTLREEVKEGAKEFSPDLILIEDKGSGISLGQELRKTTSLPIRMMGVKGDKVSRAYLSQAYLEGGGVWYVESEWAKSVINECALFPKGKNDDYTDTCTMAWNYLRTRFVLQVEQDPKEYPDYKTTDKTTKFYG